MRAEIFLLLPLTMETLLYYLARSGVALEHFLEAVGKDPEAAKARRGLLRKCGRLTSPALSTSKKPKD